MSERIDITHAAGTATGGWEGLVPVQGYGVVTRQGDRQCWYFRARGCGWRLHVGASSHPRGYVAAEDAVWTAHGQWGKWPDAGYMTDDSAQSIITDALTRYLDGEPSWDAPANLHYALTYEVDDG